MSLVLVEKPNVVAARSLAELAAAANEEHHNAQRAMGAVVLYAIRAGEALTEAVTQLPYGQRNEWLMQNFDGDVRTARTYRRLAAHKHLLIDSGVPSILAAKKHLSDLGIARGNATRADEIMRLRKEGVPTEELADMFGVSTRTVSNMCSPHAIKERKASERRRSAKREAAYRALRREEHQRDIKRSGGKISEAYALTRKLALILDSAASTAELPYEVRASLGAALRRLYGVEDMIVKASKSQ